MKYILLSWTLFLLVACGNDQEEMVKVEKAIPVKAISVNYEQHAVPVYMTGTLQAEAEMQLSFKIGGILQSLKVDEGSMVKKGQVLATLNLTEINAQLSQAKAGFEKAKRDLNRVENLFADTVATLEQLENARTAKQVAEANLQMAQFNQRHAQIIAPADGKILKRFGEENELIAPGRPIFIFSGQQQAWIIKGGAADQDRLRLNVGDEAEVELELIKDIKFQGEVRSVSGTLDPFSGVYNVEIELDQSKENLISGLIGKVTIVPKKTELTASVPLSALVDIDGLNAAIFTINGENKAKKESVNIAAILNNKVIIKSGVANGALIATEGAAYLMDGSLTKVISE